MITNAGLSAILTLVSGAVTYLAVGDDDTAPANGQTALLNELDRSPISSSGLAALAGVGTVTLESFFATSEANGDIEEIGLLTAPVAGTLYARQLPLVPRTKDATQQMRVTVVLKARTVETFA